MAEEKNALDEALKAAVAAREAMSPVERALHDDQQRRSFVRGQCGHDPGPSVLAEEVRRLQSQLAEKDRRIEELEKERDNALSRGLKVAHDVVTYCVSNWQQDRRNERDRNALVEAGRELANEIARADPTEWLDVEWRSQKDFAEERAALQRRIASLEEGLKPFKAAIDRIESWSPDAEDGQLIGPSAAIYIGDLRRARSVLQGER